VIEAAEADEFVRAGALEVLAYLTATERISREETEAYYYCVMKFWKQQGHRGRRLARACAKWRRRVVIEVSTWRSGLRGSAPGTVALGKARCRGDRRLWT
jgi:Protein of unknown function (DUF1186)